MRALTKVIPALTLLLLIIFFYRCGEESPTTNNIQPGTGLIFVDSDPPGAQIVLDNINTGKITPDTIKNLLIGDHQITLQLAGYEDTTFTKLIEKDVTKSINIVFLIPPNNISYSQHIAIVFELKCVGCPNSSLREGGVDLSTWAAILSDPRIVFPGSDSTSVLVWTIEYRSGFPSMPPLQYPGLIPNRIQGIKTWIIEGAKNN